MIMRKIALILGCALLVAMAILHGSGFAYVNGLFQASNAPSFLKDVFPVLFLLPSLQLLGLAAFGFLSTYLATAAQRVQLLTGILVLIDALLACWAQAWVPGILLTVAAGCFGVSARA